MNRNDFADISLRFLGKAHTSWYVTVYRHRESYQQLVQATEQYFNRKIYLFGSDSGPEYDLSAGVHNYPFDFLLPEKIPSTFESKYGYIRYTIKANLKAKWHFDRKVEIQFFVTTQVDIYAIPGAMVCFILIFLKSQSEH